MRKYLVPVASAVRYIKQFNWGHFILNKLIEQNLDKHCLEVAMVKQELGFGDKLLHTITVYHLGLYGCTASEAKTEDLILNLEPRRISSLSIPGSMGLLQSHMCVCLSHMCVCLSHMCVCPICVSVCLSHMCVCPIYIIISVVCLSLCQSEHRKFVFVTLSVRT